MKIYPSPFYPGPEASVFSAGHSRRRLSRDSVSFFGSRYLWRILLIHSAVFNILFVSPNARRPLSVTVASPESASSFIRASRFLCSGVSYFLIPPSRDLMAALRSLMLGWPRWMPAGSPVSKTTSFSCITSGRAEWKQVRPYCFHYSFSLKSQNRGMFFAVVDPHSDVRYNFLVGRLSWYILVINRGGLLELIPERHNSNIILVEAGQDILNLPVSSTKRLSTKCLTVTTQSQGFLHSPFPNL